MGDVSAGGSFEAPVLQANSYIASPILYARILGQAGTGYAYMNAPASISEYFLECSSLADQSVKVCQINAVGSIYCNAVTTVTGQHTADNGNFSWTHSSGEGLLRLGRQQDHSDQTVGLLDGIHHQRTIDNVLHKFNQQLHPSEPKLTISGETDDGVDWMTITDTSTNLPVFAIHNDGTVETHAWTSPDTYEHPDLSSHTTATSASSLFVGKCKLSQLQGTLNVSHLRAPPYIPEVLTGAPYSFTSGNINANTSRTILDWMALARDALSDLDAKQLRIRDVFPESAASNDFASTDGYGFQPVGGGPTRLEVDDVYCDRIVPRSDTHLKEIKVSTIKTKNRSLWLGDRIHISTDLGSAKIQYKNATVPLYLQGLTPAVTESDVTGLGATLATCTLDQWQDLSEASSGSRDLAVIFPIANTSTDFETNSSFNQIKITPDSDAGSGNSGLEIIRTTGHPLINFRGSDSVGSGYGMLQFMNENTAKANIYSSRADGHLHFDVQNQKNVAISAEELTLNGVPLLAGVATQEIFVDASYAGGNSTGCRERPYTTLTAACTAKLVDGSTTFYTFRLAPGTYTGAISHDHTSQTQSFSIVGSGANNTFLQTAADWSSQLTSNVLYFRDFINIEIRDVCIQNGAYGLYCRHIKKVTVKNCRFQYLGSKGVVTQHDQSANQASQAAYFAGNETSDGGCCRLRTINTLMFSDNEISYCLRGGRFQDVGLESTASIISGNKVYRTLEAGLYLAATSYNGTDGCLNVSVCGNTVYESFNNSILCIGGKRCTIQGNSCIGGANAGIQCWHVLDCGVIGNHIFDCNRLNFNGIGNLADAYGSLVIDGASNIGTGEYIAIVRNNTTTKCNQGRASAVYGIALFPNDTSLAYPTASNKIIVDANASDGATRFYNPNNITVTEVQTAAAGGLGSDELIENATVPGSARLRLLCKSDSANRSSIEFETDSDSNNILDRKFRLTTHPANNNSFVCQSYYLNAWTDCWQCFPTGAITFGNSENNSAQAFFTVGGHSIFQIKRANRGNHRCGGETWHNQQPQCNGIFNGLKPGYPARQFLHLCGMGGWYFRLWKLQATLTTEKSTRDFVHRDEFHRSKGLDIENHHVRGYISSGIRQFGDCSRGVSRFVDKLHM